MIVALADGGVVHGIDEDGGARASSRLLPAIEDVMQRAGLDLRDLDAIAFARGPGAFTGLRAAASAAQGLAYGLGLPVLPIGSLMLVAEAARLHLDDLHDDTIVAVAADARMGEIYTAAYRRCGDRWIEIDAASLVDPGDLAVRWSALRPNVVAGSALEVFADRLEPAAGSARIVAAPAFGPQALASLARAAWHDGAMVSAAQAQPLYVRNKVAFTTLEREAAKAAVPGATTPASGTAS